MLTHLLRFDEGLLLVQVGASARHERPLGRVLRAG